MVSDVLAAFLVVASLLLWREARRAGSAAIETADVEIYPSFDFGRVTYPPMLTGVVHNVGPRTATHFKGTIWVTGDLTLSGQPSHRVADVVLPPSLRHIVLKVASGSPHEREDVTRNLEDVGLYFAAKWEWQDGRCLLPFGIWRQTHRAAIGPEPIKTIYADWELAGYLIRQPHSQESEFQRQDQRDREIESQTASLASIAKSLERLAAGRAPKRELEVEFGDAPKPATKRKRKPVDHPPAPS